jgi:hypothetical protein
MNGVFEKLKLSVPATGWTPVEVPFDCNSVVIRNISAVNVKLRTDEAVAATEDTIAPGDQEIVDAAVASVRAGRSTRFVLDDEVCVLQSSSGTVDIMVTFLR